MEKKCALFILLGQSNAVGHGVPMKEEDIVTDPMKNVFGLSRKKHQSFDNTALFWQGYTTADMNLAEECDNSYSVANCLAKRWQVAIDQGADLPDLYVVHIAIGAQGVTGNYMWNPDRERKFIPGKLGTVDISLFSFTEHILSLVKDSFARKGLAYEVMGLHWRGGENDVTAEIEALHRELENIYIRIFDGFEKHIGPYPLVLHRIVCPDRAMDMDPTGEKLKRMHYINRVFETLAERYENASVFDATRAPQFVPDVRGNGIFIGDCVHYKPEVNDWVAKQLLLGYSEKKSISLPFEKL